MHSVTEIKEPNKANYGKIITTKSRMNAKLWKFQSAH